MYGWVKECNSFTIDDFCSKFSNRKIDELEKVHIEIMLKSISKLSENTPVKSKIHGKRYLGKENGFSGA